MKKVGIITFHNAINYGVHLQAFSLVHTIKELGYEAHVVDYRKKRITTNVNDYFKLFYRQLIGIKSILKNKIYNNNDSQKARRDKFLEFDSRFLNLTKHCDNYQDVSNVVANYHALVCGSDQIWNPFHTYCNPIYFCQNIESSRRISYAASIGTDSIPTQNETKYKRMISEIPYKSVRESSAKKILDKLGFLDCKVVVDPTLLIPHNVWQNMTKDVQMRKMPSDFVVCYILGNQEIIDRVATYYKNTGTVVINISQHIRKQNEYVIDIYPGIEEFLWLFEHAKAIYTDSYHGTMFSIIYRKCFLSFKRYDTDMNLNTRIDSFLEEIGLQDRFINVNESLEMPPLKYSDFLPKLDHWIDISYRFLAESLEKINSGN